MQRRDGAGAGPVRDPDRAPRVILGVSCDFHDAAAALLVDGEVVAAVEEERFTRVPHDDALPVGAIESCLRIAGLDADDVDLVAFYERPLTLVHRYLASRQRIGPRSIPSFLGDAPRLAARNLGITYRLDAAFGRLGRRRPLSFRFVSHHRSHAAAAFLASPFEHAAVLTVDGIGEWATASIGRGAHHRVDLLSELRYPDSMGLVYSFVTAYCGFRPNLDESKVMGLAPYGSPRHLDTLRELATPHDDGSLRVDAASLGWYLGRTPRKVQAVFGGPPRRPGEPIRPFDADLAASVQALCEETVLAMARRAHELTGEPALAMAGGVALNCVANGRVVREGPFERVWIQPAAGDAGSALGAALSVWHESLGAPRRPEGADAMRGAFLGPAVGGDEVDAWAVARGLTGRRIDDADERARVVAERLAAGDVVGWFAGRMEFGPRALGHRSILADPRSPTVRRRINAEVKGREDFRPFAPAVLAEDAREWFDLDAPSPYMLVVAQLHERHLRPPDVEPSDLADRADLPRSVLPACTHVDGSARVQTVSADTNPELHRLLAAFKQETGCGVLLNTSFNVAGEPIVASPDDALATAIASGIDLLVVEHHLFDREALAAAADRSSAA